MSSAAAAKALIWWRSGARRLPARPRPRRREQPLLERTSSRPRERGSCIAVHAKLWYDASFESWFCLLSAEVLLTMFCGVTRALA